MAKRKRNLTSEELRRLRSLLTGVRDDLREIQHVFERRLAAHAEAQELRAGRKERLRRLTFGLLGR
jgi:hypothetical protein